MDFVEAVKIVLQKGISGMMCEQSGIIEVSKNSSQESVEIVVEIILQKQMSERTREQIRVIEAPETASPNWSLQRTVEWALGDFVEVDKTIPQERISERSQVIEVPRIPCQESVGVSMAPMKEEGKCDRSLGIRAGLLVSFFLKLL